MINVTRAEERESQGRPTCARGGKVSEVHTFNVYGHDPGIDWAVVAGKGCLGREDMTDRKMGVTEGH